MTSVIDGGHFWAHVGGEIVHEKLRDIRLLLEKEASCCVDERSKMQNKFTLLVFRLN